MFAIMIRVIRAIRSLVAFVFVQKYVIEVYVSMSFCLRTIRVIRSLVDSVFVLKYVIEVYVSMSFCLRAIRVIRSLVDSVFVQKYVILSSYLILSVKCFHSRQMSRAQIASE